MEKEIGTKYLREYLQGQESWDWILNLSVFRCFKSHQKRGVGFNSVPRTRTSDYFKCDKNISTYITA